MSLRLKLALAVAAVSLAPAAAQAQKLDKEEKKWLEEVRPLMLPDEEKTFKDLKDKADRAEFQKIFWARRDPDLDTPDNEFQDAYNSSRLEVDRQFKVAGQIGSATDCGRVYLLLGKPDDMKVDKQTGDTPSLRPPEVWTFRDRPGQTFAGGQVQIGFEKDCQLPQGARLGEQLNRVAESKIVNSNVTYKKGPDGRLRLADQVPKPNAAAPLIKNPRQDFPLTGQTAMMLRSPEGATYIAGLAHATGLPAESATGKSLPVELFVQAVDSQGRTAGKQSRQVNGELSDDGRLTASYGLTLRPGTYTVTVAMVDPKSGKGSVATVPIDVPDLKTGELTLVPLVLLREIEQSGTVSPKDPLADFTLGTNRLIPSPDSVFSKSGSLNVIGAVYNASTDPTTGLVTMEDYQAINEGMSLADVQAMLRRAGVEGARSGAAVINSWTNPDGSGIQLTFQDGRVTSKAQSGLEKHLGNASVSWSFSILKDGKQMAKTEDQVVTTTVASPSIGPVPLEKFNPGKYVVQLRIRDNVTKKEYTKDAPFEVR